MSPPPPPPPQRQIQLLLKEEASRLSECSESSPIRTYEYIMAFTCWEGGGGEELQLSVVELSLLAV